MSLCFLLDGYNILKKIPQITDYKIKEDRPSFINFISRFHPQGRNKAIIIFDGYGDEQLKYVKIDVLFSKDISADDYIVKMLGRKGEKCYYCVVTDDRQLQFRAKNSEAKVLSVDDFLKPAFKKMKARGEKNHQEKINEYSKEAQEIKKELERIWLKK